MGSGPLPPPPPQQQQQGGQQHSAASHHHHHGPKGSIYALTMTPSGSLLATGTTESFIRVYDPRSHTKAMKLKARGGHSLGGDVGPQRAGNQAIWDSQQSMPCALDGAAAGVQKEAALVPSRNGAAVFAQAGRRQVLGPHHHQNGWSNPLHGAVLCPQGHTDNVRALQLNDAGTLLLSASSDDTVRLWDMRQQRCIQVRGACACVVSVCCAFAWRFGCMCMQSSALQQGVVLCNLSAACGNRYRRPARPGRPHPAHPNPHMHRAAPTDARAAHRLGLVPRGHGRLLHGLQRRA
jgi:hypothetical protein